MSAKAAGLLDVWRFDRFMHIFDNLLGRTFCALFFCIAFKRLFWVLRSFPYCNGMDSLYWDDPYDRRIYLCEEQWNISPMLTAVSYTLSMLSAWPFGAIARVQMAIRFSRSIELLVVRGISAH